MSFFNDLVSRGIRHVLDTAAGAATRQPESTSVVEIPKSQSDQVASYEVTNRKGCLVLHGPINNSATVTQGNRQSSYNIILHVPHSEKMFSLFRTETLNQANEMFQLYRETLPTLVDARKQICDRDQLDKICSLLRQNRGWTVVHVAAALDFHDCFKEDTFNKRLNEQDSIVLMTPLQVAISHKNCTTVSTLLDLGASADIKDIKENTVFHTAASASEKMLQVLCQKVPESKLVLIDHLNTEGYTPLHLACKSDNGDVVKLLLTNKANVTVPSATDGKFPIHYAVQKSFSCVQELISCNPSQLDFTDRKEGGNPLHWASGSQTIIPLLELGCDPNHLNFNGETALHKAARQDCLKSTLSLLCHKAFPDLKGKDGNTAMHIAAKFGFRSVVQALMVFGADVNITNNDGDSPLHVAATSTFASCSDHSRNLLIHCLHAVRAKRCPATKGSHCSPGCSFTGTFTGTEPLGFFQSPNNCVMHEALYVLSVKKEVNDRSRLENEMGILKLQGDTTDSMDTGHSRASHSEVGGRLLCLDGGGIRGIVLTQILFVMEQEFGMPAIEMFDWVAGTSTGGIVALALASGKSVLECQAIYLRLKDKVFVGARPYSAEIMEEFLKQEFGSERKLGQIKEPRVMIMSAIADRRPADLHIFRNYLSPTVVLGEPHPDFQHPDSQFVWETAKVTGAAPSYFRLDHEKFIDGGLIANNPTLDALTELQQLNAATRTVEGADLCSVSTVVSLGCGIQPLQTNLNTGLLDIAWPSGVLDAVTKVPKMATLISLLVDQATQSEGQVVERSRAWCSSLGIPFFRFSPQMTKEIDLDEKDDTVLVNLLWETRAYMISNRAQIIELKSSLVRPR